MHHRQNDNEQSFVHTPHAVNLSRHVLDGHNYVDDFNYKIISFNALRLKSSSVNSAPNFVTTRYVSLIAKR